MKICTITCHDVYNHGASLQAYALMKYLLNCGHEVEIINYKPNYLSNHYNLFSVDNPKWEKNILIKYTYLALKIPLRVPGLKRKKAFDKFTSNNLKLTSKKYETNSQLEEDTPEADVFLCGSDQIWNCLHENGKDPAFYLQFVPSEKIKASYAASFATDDIRNEYKPIVKERVNNLDYISVRESSGVKLLEKMGIKDVVNVVDPAFLLNRNDWNNLAQTKLSERFLVVYDFEDSEIIKEIALSISKLRKCKIYAIGSTKVSYAHKSFIYDGPDVFISLIRDANFVISNSFHSIVFSIIFEKDFAIVNRKEAINTRMRDLLRALNLEDRLITNSFNEDLLNESIDFDDCREIMANKIEVSKKFLQKVLDHEKGFNNAEESIVCN
ncbi:polysaccharide pyruvyl transferase family protein [Alkalihalobacterium bogoriense]|uniref:polysaccharide pyruvyl transferase family protein n=1 Tax=Alkalihalobacterium bogoriense TaxID=246272 RepID=UPI00068516D0|nr:polysaccharide pyruvyl transferase family protein [Alkalihalobacterium bogoriense]